MSRGFSGMPGGGGNMNQLMKQAQQMQQRLQQVQEEIREKTAEGTSGGGMVTIVANGKNELVSVKINPEVLAGTPDAEMLQDLILTAANQALQNVQTAASEAMAKVTGGMNIPGLF